MVAQTQALLLYASKKYNYMSRGHMGILWKWRAFYLKEKTRNTEGNLGHRLSPSHNDQKAPPGRIITSKLRWPNKALLITVSRVPLCSMPHLSKESSSAFNQFANRRKHWKSRYWAFLPLFVPTASPSCLNSPCPAPHLPRCNLIFTKQSSYSLQILCQCQ